MESSKEKVKELLRQGEYLLDYWAEIKEWKRRVGVSDFGFDPGIYHGLDNLQEQLEMFERYEW